MQNRQRTKRMKLLMWKKSDIEERLGLKGAKYTDVNLILTSMAGLLFTIIFYGLLILLPGKAEDILVAALFLKRGYIPYFIIFFTFWALAILIVKWFKLRLQRRALTLMVVPQSQGFEVTTETAKDILMRLYGLVDDTQHFVLLNRIERALANLKNIGLISDVSEILAAQAQNDEDYMESSYAIIRGLIWAIPILGFIGTVLGLSSAIGDFGSVLSKSQDVANIKSSLQSVTGGLSVAFDTTLIALIAALCVQLVMTGIKKKEENFLDDCKEYCHANIISKLRLASSMDTMFNR